MDADPRPGSVFPVFPGFFLRRVVLAIPLLLFVSMLVFALIHAAA